MLPFGEWMKFAGGVLNWPEDRFWEASPVYFFAAWRGYLESRGVSQSSRMSEDDWEAFKQEHAAELAMTTDDLKRLRERQKRKAG